MKKIILSLVCISLFYVTNAQRAADPVLTPVIENNNYNEIVEKYNNYFEALKEQRNDLESPLKSTGFKVFKRWEYFWSSRVDADGNFPTKQLIDNSYSQFKQHYINDKSNRTQATNEWQELGPYNYPGGNLGLGRINAIAVHPQDNNIIYIGAATGGVWKTTNSGLEWENLETPEVFSYGITNIAISKSNPKIIVAATGDGNGVEGGAGYGAFTSGLIKSTNEGASWSEVNIDALSANQEQFQTYLIYKIIIDPTNSSRMFAGTSEGVFISTNGGSSWNESIGILCRDLVMHPTNPNILYGAFDNDNGSFSIIKYENGNWNNAQSYNIGNCVRVALSVNEQFPDVCVGVSGGLDQSFLNAFRTDNAGATWSETANKNNSKNYLGVTDGSQQGGQAFYDLAIALSPNSKNEIIIGGISNWKSTNGGSNFERFTESYTNTSLPNLHPDQHIIVYDNEGNILIGNDGGIYKSTNNGTSFNNITEGLNITQYYRFGQSNTDSKVLLAGAQDNGTHLTKNKSFWNPANGGDGFDCDIDPINPNIMYSSNYNQSTGVFYRSNNGGNSFSNIIITPFVYNEAAQWVAPLTLDENNSDLYVGYFNVYKSTNQGSSFTKISNFNTNRTISEIAIAPSNSNYVYIAVANQVKATTNGGSSWKDVFTAPGISNVESMAVNPEKPNEVYAVLSGYSNGNKVFRIVNSNSTNISGSLPNFPVNTIAFQKNSNNRLYIGTDIGVFTREGNSDWQYFNEGLPQVIVSELKLHYPSGMLRAATYGRGMWEIPFNDCTLDAPIVNSNIEIENDRIEVCKNEELELSLESGNYDSFEWSNGAKTKTIKPNKSGTYSVTLYTNDGCESKSENFDVVLLDYDDIKIIDDEQNEISSISFCENDSVRLRYSGFYKDAKWSSGENTRTIWVNQEGDYSVSAFTTQGGCETVSQSVTVTRLPAPNKPVIEFSDNGELYTSITGADQYRWFKDGNIILGAEDRKYRPTSSGDYTVEIIYNDLECTGISDNYSYSTSSVDITQNKGQISITPNPFEDKILVSLKEKENVIQSIDIYSIEGKLVYRTNRLSGLTEYELNLNQLITGTYILHIRTKNETITEKINKK